MYLKTPFCFALFSGLVPEVAIYINIHGLVYFVYVKPNRFDISSIFDSIQLSSNVIQNWRMREYSFKFSNILHPIYCSEAVQKIVSQAESERNLSHVQLSQSASSPFQCRLAQYNFPLISYIVSRPGVLGDLGDLGVWGAWLGVPKSPKNLQTP